MSVRIHELAVPKGNVVPLCEICGQKATTKCEKCMHTHYCSEYHKTVDNKSFHKSVCDTIADIRKEHPIPFTEEDRKVADNAMLKRKRGLQTLAELTARNWLLQENAEYAYPAAMSALNVAKALEAPKSLQLVYPTCLVAESCLGLGHIKAAQDYVVLASWVSQNHEKLPPTTCAQLQRVVGLVCMNTGKWEQARKAFSEFLYAVSVEHGTADIRMAVAYGLVGLSLLKFDEEEGAMASFHKMSDMWLESLLIQYQMNMIRCATDVEMQSDPKIRELEFQYMESKIVFRWVYEDVRNLGVNPTTDLINFKILCVQALQQIREGRPSDVYQQEALAIGTRTKQDKAVPKDRIATLIEVLGDDYLIRWEKRNNRPRTVATKYLEMIKQMNI